MARLGELLVAAGLLTLEQVEQALRAQVMWGARLGTNLVELGLIDLDTLSTYLGRQHNLPAALARHFEKVDRELQRQLSPDLAELFCCVPLLRAGPQQQNIVIASSSPLPKKAMAKIADELGVEPHQLISAIAAELRVRYQLERVYGISRPARFMRTPGGGIPQVPMIDADPFHEDSDIELQPYDAAPASVVTEESVPIALPVIAEPSAGEPGVPPAEAARGAEAREVPIAEDRAGAPVPVRPANLDELSPALDDDLAVPSAVEDEPSGRERRKYVRTIADGPEEHTLARIAIRRVAVAPASGLGNTLGEATRAIRRATDRDRVAELCMQTIERFAQSCEAAALLITRGQVATTWKGFCRHGDGQTELSVPLDQPGLVPRAVARSTTVRSPSSDLGAIDRRLLASLGHGHASHRDLVIVPIPIGAQVVCVLAMVTEPDAPSGTAETIAAAVGAAFARLMRNASR